jgi:hypothetical protein
MNIQVDNPVCILNQETAKNFLHNNDAQQKYKLFERATQIDAIHNEYLVAKEEISTSKSCLEGKLQVCFLFTDYSCCQALFKLAFNEMPVCDITNIFTS